MEKLQIIEDIDKIIREHTKMAHELSDKYPYKYYREFRAMAKYQDILKRIDKLKKSIKEDFIEEEKQMEQEHGV